jgi:hypothetical protein
MEPSNNQKIVQLAAVSVSPSPLNCTFLVSGDGKRWIEVSPILDSDGRFIALSLAQPKPVSEGAPPCRGKRRPPAPGSEALRAIERAGGMEACQGFRCLPPAPPRYWPRRMACRHSARNNARTRPQKSSTYARVAHTRIVINLS